MSRRNKKIGYMTHDDLIVRAVKWLRNTVGCSAVASEMASSAHWEIPDAIGWNSMHSYLIECKTSRSDFKQDLKKHSRRHPKTGVGNFRFYMAEPKMIKPHELPEGWGLLEVHPKIVRRIVPAARFSGVEIAHHERPILVRLVRRLNEKDMSRRNE